MTQFWRFGDEWMVSRSGGVSAFTCGFHVIATFRLPMKEFGQWALFAGGALLGLAGLLA